MATDMAQYRAAYPAFLRCNVCRLTKKGRRGGDPDGQKEPNGWASGFDGVAALFVLGLGGGDRQPHLLAQGAGQEPADRMRLMPMSA